jgi:hypothetical protein
MFRSAQHDTASYELFLSGIRPNRKVAGVAGPPISGRLPYFSEGTVHQGSARFGAS